MADASTVSRLRQHREAASHGVSLREAFRVWARVAMLSFGGPAGQIAVMHRIIVEEKRWIGENRFLHALNYCMLLPGPEAQQLATYIGWLMHRTLGGLIAGVLFVLPGVVVMLGLSVLYATLGEVPAIAALFFGLKAAVLVLVVEALLRVARRALKTNAAWALAGAALSASSQADLRYWEMLPRTVYIVPVALGAGGHTIEVQAGADRSMPLQVNLPAAGAAGGAYVFYFRLR